MSSDPFVCQLAELCRAHRTRAKWVFVPAHSTGHTLGERLAREGCDWANLRFVTPLDVALRMAAPFMVEQGIGPSEEALGPALMMRLLLDLPEERGYFRPMADHPTLAEALWRTVRELRYAGLRAADLKPAFFASAEKYAELSALLAAYERHLGANHIADMPMVFEEAVGHADWCPIQPDDVVVEMPGVAWPPVARLLIDACPGHRIVSKVIDIPKLGAPSRLSGLAAATESVGVAPASDAARLCFLRAPDEAGPARDDGSLEVFRAGGHDAEVDAIIRRIMASALALDQVELVCVSDTLTLTAWEKARRLGWPVTLSAGVPASATRPGRALLRWCEWVEENFSASALRVLLQSNDISLRNAPGEDPEAPDSSGLGPGLAARLLINAGCTWGRTTYASALEAYATDLERDAAEEGDESGWRGRRAMQCRVLGRWAQGLVDAVPEGDDQGKVAVGAVLDPAAQFVQDHAMRASDLDHLALADILRAIERLRTLGTSRVPLGLALRLLEQAVGSVRIARSRPRPGHLHISDQPDAGWDGRPMAFVCGLAEAQVFPAAVEDPVLLDAEREAIARAGGPVLATSADRLADSVRSVVTTLARLGASASRVTLSFSCVDARDFRTTYPSWLALQAWRIKTAAPAATYEQMQKALGEPVSAVPGKDEPAPAPSSWWLRAARVGEVALPAVARAFPFVVRGRAAEVARETDEVTAFDGLVPEAGPELDPARTDRVVSATLLQSAAACPFRFFLEHGLGIDPIEEDEANEDEWLGALRRGSELHELYAALLRRARDEKRRVSVAEDLEWLLARARTRLEELKQEIPPPSDEVCAVESDELLEDVRMFVHAEAEANGVEPVGFEVAFGHPGGRDDRPEPLAQAEPAVITIGSGRRVRLRGRIDRIDRVGRSAYQVLDYKTGRYKSDDYDGTFRQGRLLQHALYGVAAENLLKPHDECARVTQGVYWHPTGRGNDRRRVIPAPAKAELVDVLARISDVIAAGVFIQAPEESTCRYCPFAAACGQKPWETSARKVEGDGSGILQPWQALQEVE